MPYNLRYSRRFIKAFKGIPVLEQKRIYRALDKLKEDPFPKGKGVKHIKGPSDEFWRLRIGDYRILYRVEGNNADVEDLVHRSELERVLRRR
jgi:mRNA-degrading endonuclease RelE of RelBE toxin-antitoxin system